LHEISTYLKTTSRLKYEGGEGRGVPEKKKMKGELEKKRDEALNKKT